MAQVTGQIVLSKRFDNDLYRIVSSTEDIVRFRKKNSEGDEVFETSPEKLSIELYKNEQLITLKEAQEGQENQEGYKFYILNSQQNLSNFLSLIEEVEGEDKIKVSTLFFDVQDFVNKNKINTSLTFVFEYKINNKIVISRAFQLRDGVSEDMAKFNITAASINASVGKSKMKFTDTGLEINDGDFIIKQKDQLVFGFKANKLTMYGAIYAEEGHFNGEIHATKATFDDGVIGGFNIKTNKLVSQSNVYIQTQDLIPTSNKDYYINNEGIYEKVSIEEFDSEVTYYEQHSSISFNGEDGSVYANKIILGSNADIESFIKLGEAYLYNPDKNNNKLLESGREENGKILIKDDGTAKFGKIEIDGANSKIYGTNWNIQPSFASFNNIEVSGAIKTSVFETETTQAIGGAMLFLPSYKIYKQDGVIIFQKPEELWYENGDCKMANGSMVWLVDEKNNYENATIEVNKEEKKITIITENLGDYNPIALVNIGIANDAIKPIIMGINSSSIPIANNHLRGPGLTITRYGDNFPNLFLGDLDSLGKNDYKGYGLYADNVYLNGSLTTKVKEASYAGINTLDGVNATVFENDKTRIVFWAGAESTEKEAIQKAYFQVTEDGSVFASRAKLTDTLIVGGILKATDIYTATLHGNGGALSIYDDSNGIQFISSTGNNIFSIKADGLQTANSFNFIKIEGDEIVFSGHALKTHSENNYLQLITENGVPVLKHVEGDNYCGLYFENISTSFKMKNNIIQKWDQKGTNLYGQLFLKQEAQLEYKPVKDGYDLYVIKE